MVWNVEEHGTGRPLVLIHGIGSSLRVWDPVVPHLAARRRVLAVDLPGHGGTPAPDEPAQRLVPATAADLVAELARRAVPGPVDVAGNSLGGWTALEMAKLGAARSVVTLSPGGLWEASAPPGIGTHFRLLRAAGLRLPRLARALLRHPVGRTVALGSLFGRPWRVSPEAALAAYEGFVATDGLLDLLQLLAPTRFEGGAVIEVPVTVAFGTRDLLLRRRARFAGALPPTARWVALPGCGHVPTWDDVELVSQVILQGTA